MREQRHQRFLAHERLERRRRAHSDVRKPFRRGLHFKAAIGEQERPVRAQVAIGNAHNEERAHERGTRSGLENLEARAQDVARGVTCTGDHAVRSAGLHEHHAEVQHVVELLARFLDGHALGFADLVERLRQALALGIAGRVDDARTLEVAPACRNGPRITEDHEVGHVVGQHALSGLERPRIVALRQDDGLLLRLRAGHDGIKKCAHRLFPSRSNKPMSSLYLTARSPRRASKPTSRIRRTR